MGGENEDKEGDSQEEEEDDIPKIVSSLLLNEFHSHIAKYIYEGSERPMLKCHNHVGELLKWKLDDKDNRQFQSYIRVSKLLKLRKSSYKNPK